MPDDFNHLSKKKMDREQALATERREFLAMTPEKALDAVLSHPYPVTLVQSMAEEDLYLLVHSVGVDDALELLGMASNEQWEYFLDMETWTRDRVDIHGMTEWLDRLSKADPDRFIHWIVNEQRDAFEHYLFRNIELHVREYDKDPAEIDDAFETEDHVHYIRMRPYAPTDENAPQRQALRDQFLGDLLRRISVFDYPLYQTLLLESSAVIPAEAEEELLRLRNVRLAEKGFLPFEEAVGIYQPLASEDLPKRGRKPAEMAGRPVESYPLRVSPADLPPDADRFQRTLSRIHDTVVLQRLQAEFAGLCNQMISADQKIVRERSSLSDIVAKVSHTISIGLEKADQDDGSKDPYHSEKLLQNYLLADIFRVGYGCALDLKWRVDRWRRDGWFGRSGLPLTFWGETWLGALGGLLLKKPLYFDNYARGVLYREFETLADIETTAGVLDDIFAMDDLLSRIGVEIDPIRRETPLTCHNLLLTMWADARLGVDASAPCPKVLTLDQFRRFFQDLWTSGETPRRIRDGMREDFLQWLADRSGRANYDIAERLGPVLEELFGRVEEELGGVTADDLDPRFIQLFLVRK